MKITAITTAAFLLAGAVGGYFQEAFILRHDHMRGVQLPLQNWMYSAIQAAIFGIVGCFIGLLVGLILNWLVGRPTSETVNY